LAKEATVIFDAESNNLLATLSKVHYGIFEPLENLKNPVLAFLAGLCVSVPISVACGLVSWSHRNGPFHQSRHTYLQALVDMIARSNIFRSGHHKNVKIILYLDHLNPEDLKILLNLLKSPDCPVTFEVWWTQWLYPLRHECLVKYYQEKYGDFVSTAAEGTTLPKP